MTSFGERFSVSLRRKWQACQERLNERFMACWSLLGSHRGCSISSVCLGTSPSQAANSLCQRTPGSTGPRTKRRRWQVHASPPPLQRSSQLLFLSSLQSLIVLNWAIRLRRTRSDICTTTKSDGKTGTWHWETKIGELLRSGKTISWNAINACHSQSFSQHKIIPRQSSSQCVIPL